MIPTNSVLPLANILATLFSLFDKGLNFKVVSECVTSKTVEIDDAARKIIRRQFGNVIIEMNDIDVLKRKKGIFAKI